MFLLACFTMTVLLMASQHVADAGPNPAHYDQRQDGNYNVKIHLKDFKLISLGSLNSDSLDGEYDDSNYDYEDPPDPAEKPETSTTKAPPTTSKPIKLDNASLANNLTIKDVKLDTNVSLTNNLTIKDVKLDSNASLTNNSTIKDVKLDGGNNSTHAALTSLTNATSTPDCPEKNGTTTRLEETPSSSGRPARVQPSHVTRHRTSSTPRPTPYHPYSIISTTKRPVKQGVMRKMRCRPGYLRDRGGRCRKVVREQSKAETS